MTRALLLVPAALALLTACAVSPPEAPPAGTPEPAEAPAPEAEAEAVAEAPAAAPALPGGDAVDGLLGDWVGERLVFGGKVAPDEVAQTFHMRFEADVFHIGGAAGYSRKAYRYAADADTEPPSMTVMAADGQFADIPAEAIFQLDGDALKVVMPNRPGLERPAAFESPEGSPWALFEMKRTDLTTP